MTRHRLAAETDISEGSMRSIQVGDRLICLANLGGGKFGAIDDVCTHEEELLSDGFLCDLEVECPAHGSRFGFEDGKVTGLPATRPSKAYEVTVEGGAVYLEDD